LFLDEAISIDISLKAISTLVYGSVMPEHMRCSAPVLLSGIQIDCWQVTLMGSLDSRLKRAGMTPHARSAMAEQLLFWALWLAACISDLTGSAPRFAGSAARLTGNGLVSLEVLTVLLEVLPVGLEVQTVGLETDAVSLEVQAVGLETDAVSLEV